MQEIISLEQFETLNRTAKEPPKRPYRLMLWDQSADKLPCWTSDPFKFRPEDLLDEKTSAAIMIKGALKMLAADRDITNLKCLITTGTHHFAKPIVRGYYQHLIDAVLK